MKFLIIFSCLIVYTLSATIDTVLQQGSFSELFTTFVTDINNIPEELLTKDELEELKSKIFCIKNKIEFEENKNKSIEEVTSTYFFIGASALCMSNQVEFWHNAADKLNAIAKSQETIRIDHIECLQWEFSKFQPDSRLLRNFNANLSQDEKDMCRKLEQLQQIKSVTRYFDVLSGGFSELTCGSVNNKVALELVMNVLLLSNEQDPKIVELEQKRIADIVKEKVIIMVDCVKDNLSL